MKFKIRLLAALFAFNGAAIADEDANLARLLDSHTHEIFLDEGQLSGPGAELILTAAAGSQFVALGEEHFNYIIPDITTALFSALSRGHGYQYLMVEQDPAMMHMMSRSSARGDVDAIRSLLKQYPLSVTFDADEELQMIADVGRLSSSKADPVWGCDQAFGVTHALDLLAEQIEDDAALSAVREFRAEAATAEATRDLKNGHFIYQTPTERFEELKATVAPDPGSQAAWLLDNLIHSSRIYGFYENGQSGVLPGYYENNRYREEHLKDLCLARYRAAETQGELPRAILKFGSWHLYQGLSPTRLHTIGDFFANVARFNGQEFLSLHFSSHPENLEESMDDLGFVWPFIGSLDPDTLAVVDLRPFRSYPNRVLIEKSEGEAWVGKHKEDFVRLVYGYDMIFFVGAHRPATFTVLPSAD